LILQGLLLSLFAGLATGIGGLVILLVGRLSRRILDFIMGIASGMMLTVSFTSLIHKAMDLAGLSFTSLGFALGSILLLVVDFTAPHANIGGLLDRATPDKLRRGLVIAVGIAIHNMPEGFAVASGFSADVSLGILIALVIGAHNVPEGMITAIPLREAGASRPRILLITLLAGLTEPATAIIALLLLQKVGYQALALSSAFAAGAMVYITVDELIPEVYAHGEGHAAVMGITFGVLASLILMTFV